VISIAWDDTQSASDNITHTEWNTMVTDIKSQWCSGNYVGHSSNTDIHFPSSSIRPWLDAKYKGTGAAASTSWSGATGYIGHSSNVLIHMPSSQIRPWLNAVYKGTGAAVGGGITGWYDLDTGTGITAFGGAVAISGTQAETLSVDMSSFVESSTATSRFADSSNIQSKFIHSAGYNASGAFYPSSLGKGVSSQVLLNTSAYNWYTESSQKLTTISSNLSTRINDINALDGDTISSNFFLVGSGNTLWDWYEVSSSKLSALSGSLSDRINAAGGILAGDLVGNLSGASYVYGLQDINFLSSQAISSNTTIGNTITLNSYYSSQSGIFVDWVSGNTSNLIQSTNVDGGTSSSVYGGITGMDGGDST